MAVARRHTHHWLNPSSRVGWIRTDDDLPILTPAQFATKLRETS